MTRIFYNFIHVSRMDAIRKKMQSLKSETDQLYSTIAGFEEATREASSRADQVSAIYRKAFHILGQNVD